MKLSKAKSLAKNIKSKNPFSKKSVASLKLEKSTRSWAQVVLVKLPY
jgi:hypothetical protein